MMSHSDPNLQQEYDAFVAGIEAEYNRMYDYERRYWSDHNDADAACAQLDQWRAEQIAWANCTFWGVNCDES